VRIGNKNIEGLLYWIIVEEV